MDAASENAVPPKKSKIRIVLRRLIWAVLLVAFMWSPCCPKYYSSCGPVASPRNAWLCPIPLPDSARNIQYKHFSFFQAYETYVRFEAPVADCIKHVDKALDGSPTRDSDLYYPPGPLRPVDPNFKREHPITLCSSSWFDVERLKNGLRTQHPGGPMIPNIWIDTDRGVFYFLVTD